MLLPRKSTSIEGKDSVRVGVEGDGKALDESTCRAGGQGVSSCARQGIPGLPPGRRGNPSSSLPIRAPFGGYVSAMQESFGVVGH